MDRQITIKQGERFRRIIELQYAISGQPVNLTGYEAAAQLRTKPGADLVADFTAEVTAAIGRVSVELSAEQTAGIAPGLYGYDIFVSGEDGDRHCLYTERVEVVRPYTEAEEVPYAD